MPPTLTYYVSGHGFGHARRSIEVVRSLLAVRPDATVHFRTSAPRHVFASILAENVLHHPVSLDPGAVERDILSIDPGATLREAQCALDQAPALLRSEERFLRQSRSCLILADIPFLAGRIADAAGLPALAISNFTWDWIYEPFLASRPEYGPLVDAIRRSHGHFAAILHLPWGGSIESFRQAIEVPLVAAVSRQAPERVLPNLSIDLADDRQRILVAIRGGVSADALRVAAQTCPEMLFLCPNLPGEPPAANILPVLLRPEIDFADLVAISDVVVSKLGYGILADCIAARTPLLWPARAGFREDELTSMECPQYLTMRQIAAGDFLAGNWSDDLRQLLSAPEPAGCTRTDGAAACAALIADRL